MEEIKKKLFAAEDAHKEWFEEISRTVFQHPELGDPGNFSPHNIWPTRAEGGLPGGKALLRYGDRVPL